MGQEMSGRDTSEGSPGRDGIPVRAFRAQGWCGHAPLPAGLREGDGEKACPLDRSRNVGRLTQPGLGPGEGLLRPGSRAGGQKCTDAVAGPHSRMW